MSRYKNILRTASAAMLVAMAATLTANAEDTNTTIVNKGTDIHSISCPAKPSKPAPQPAAQTRQTRQRSTSSSTSSSSRQQQNYNYHPNPTPSTHGYDNSTSRESSGSRSNTENVYTGANS